MIRALLLDADGAFQRTGAKVCPLLAKLLPDRDVKVFAEAIFKAEDACLDGSADFAHVLRDLLADHSVAVSPQDAIDLWHEIDVDESILSLVCRSAVLRDEILERAGKVGSWPSTVGRERRLRRYETRTSGDGASGGFREIRSAFGSAARSEEWLLPGGRTQVRLFGHESGTPFPSFPRREEALVVTVDRCRAATRCLEGNAHRQNDAGAPRRAPASLATEPATGRSDLPRTER